MQQNRPTFAQVSRHCVGFQSEVTALGQTLCGTYGFSEMGSTHGGVGLPGKIHSEVS